MAVPDSYIDYYSDLSSRLKSDLNPGGQAALNNYYNTMSTQLKKDMGYTGESYDNIYAKQLKQMQKDYGVDNTSYNDIYNQQRAQMQKDYGVDNTSYEDIYAKNLEQMKKDYGITGPVDYNTYQNYYNTLSQQLLNDIGKVEYNPLSAGTIKSGLQKIIRPTYEKSIQNRQESTKANQAAIDADAAARGIGSSSWVTDAKQRQLNAEARDVANLNADYGSALYSALMNRLAQQDQLDLAAQQANLGARQAAAGNALSAAGSLYSTDKANLNTALQNALQAAQYQYGQNQTNKNAALSAALTTAGNLYGQNQQTKNNALSAALSTAGNLYNIDRNALQTALSSALNTATYMYGKDADVASQAASNALSAAQYLYSLDQANSGGGGGGGGRSGSGTKKEQVPDDYGGGTGETSTVKSWDKALTSNSYVSPSTMSNTAVAYTDKGTGNNSKQSDTKTVAQIKYEAQNQQKSNASLNPYNISPKLTLKEAQAEKAAKVKSGATTTAKKTTDAGGNKKTAK